MERAFCRVTVPESVSHSHNAAAVSLQVWLLEAT